jgi:hypothetical protein
VFYSTGQIIDVFVGQPLASPEFVVCSLLAIGRPPDVMSSVFLAKGYTAKEHP